MGDRTFSADDVIRIYQDFLTSSEQKTVDLFFMEEPEPVEPLPDVTSLLSILELLLGILVNPVIAAIAATFSTFALLTLNGGIRALRETNEILGNIIEGGDVNA